MDKQRFDISKATRDELQYVLCAAKNEWKRYANCRLAIERYECYIEKERKEADDRDSTRLGCFVTFSVLLWGFWLLYFPYLFIQGLMSREHQINILLFVFIPILFFLLLAMRRHRSRRSAQIVKKLKKRYEPQLLPLKKEEDEAKSEFKEIWNIPYTYWDEYALTKMLQYIENYEASNWERATDLYKEDEYRRIMRENAQMTLAEAREQTELARQTRNNARSAAFGAWAAAAGAWR